MGNTDLHDKNLNCGVRTQVATVPDGHKITGVVYVEALQPIQRCTMHLTIFGQESVEWYETHSDVRYGGQHTFFNSELTVADFGSNINKGTYQCGFTIMLPPNMPSPMLFRGSQSSMAKVAYTTKVLFRHPKFNKDLAYEFPINMAFKSIAPPNLALKLKIDHDSMCCCCTRGHLTGSVHLNKSLYTIGETISLYIRLGQLEQSISCINFTLRKKCHMKATSKSKSFYQNIKTYKMPGISKSDALRQIKHQIMLNGVGTKEMSPTYVGQVIIFTYEIATEFVIEGACAGTCQVIIPFMLRNESYQPQFIMTNFDLPPNWAPHSYPSAQFATPAYVEPNWISKQNSLSQEYPGIVFSQSGSQTDTLAHL